MTMIIVLLVLITVGLMLFFMQRQGLVKAKNMLKLEQEKRIELEKKLDLVRIDFKKSKEELEKGKLALKEARELAKKKIKRKMEGDNEPHDGSEIAMTAKALEDSYKAISALEIQMETLKEDQQKNETVLKSELLDKFSQEILAKNKEIDDLKIKLNESLEEVKRQKRLMRPEGQKIDLKSLPDEAAAEFSRIYRKAEQHERLHGIARAKLHLAQEKFTELQKRYFNICRELALLSGHKEELDATKARDIAEDLVSDHQVKEEKEQNL